MLETIKTNEIPAPYLAPAYQTSPLDDLGVSEAAKRSDTPIMKVKGEVLTTKVIDNDN